MRGITQISYDLDLFNNTGADADFAVSVVSELTTNCPATGSAAAGATVPFGANPRLPRRRLREDRHSHGQQREDSDSATITSKPPPGGAFWLTPSPSPFATQNSPVISWDGKLYIVGGVDNDLRR